MTVLPAPTHPSPAQTGSLADAVDQLAPAVVGFIAGRWRSSGIAWGSGLWVGSAQALARRGSLQIVIPNGESHAAEVHGVDAATDLAVVRLAATAGVAAEQGATPDITADATNGTNASQTPVPERTLVQARVGDAVFAVGREPSGLVQASFGRIGSVGGEWRSGRQGRIEAWIRLDGGLYAGLEGAAVADCRGQLIGMASSAFSRSHGVVLPARTIDRVVDALLTHGQVPEGYLGIAAQPVRAQLEGAPVEGLLVSSLAEAGPAEKAGLLVGDVILAVAGVPVARLSDLREHLQVGSRVRLAIVRGGRAEERAVDVVQRPQPARRCG